MQKSKRVTANSTTTDRNRIEGYSHEDILIEVFKSQEIDTIKKTKASGATYGDQDLVLVVNSTVYRISAKHKTQSAKALYPTLCFSEICEPINYVNLKAPGEIPTTIVTWRSNEENNGNINTFVLIPIEHFISLLKNQKKEEEI